MKLAIMLAFATLVVISTLFYVQSVVLELKDTLQLVETYSESRATNSSGSEVEAEALTGFKSLERYLAFVDAEFNAKEFLKEQRIDLSTKSREVSFSENGKIPRIILNDCKRVNCMQNRVDFEGIAPSLWKGLLGIEDYRFLEHMGVDPLSILRAIIVDIKAMRLKQGGSTLTQQLVKNLFLTNDKTFERKIKEIIYAIYIEHFFTKEQIITAYFNEVFWGTIQGVYIKGVDSAARIYFDKPAKYIDEFEAAILISLLKGPYYYHPIHHSDRLRERVEVVFSRLKQLNLIEESFAGWNEKKWNNWTSGLKEKDKDTYLRTLVHFAGENNLLNDYEKFVLLEGVNNFLKDYKNQNQEHDLAIKIYMQPVDCSSPCDRTFKYYSKFERKLEEAIDSEKHQIGSIMKPLVYSLFLNHGKNLNDKVSTEEITLKLKSGDWSPRDSNLWDGEEITLLQALQKSKNRPLIRLTQEIGFDVVEKELLGYFPDLQRPLSEFPAQLLGAMELSLKNVGQIYQKFNLKTCEKIRNGELEFDDSIFYHMAQAEKTTISNFARGKIGTTLIFGKTGTTNNGKDNWYVASDGNLISVVWVGIETGPEGEKYGLSGASSAFKIYQNFIVNRGKRLSEIYCM